MKSLDKFMMESLINEAFGSKILAEILPTNLLKTSYREYQLQWDKIKDDMLEELDEDQGRAAQRKRTESNYLIWVAKNWKTQDMGKVYLITWGPDIVWCSDRYRGESTKAMIDSRTVAKVYRVKDPSPYFQRELQDLRREQKRDAAALMDCSHVLEANRKRWKQALAKMHTGSMDDVVKMYEDAMKLYSETIKNWVAKYTSMITSVDCPSTWEIRKAYTKLQDTVAGMLDEVESYQRGAKHGTNPEWSKRNYDNIVKFCQMIGELCTKLTQDQE